MEPGKEIKIQITLRGVRPIMFDRYAGDNKTELPPEKKMYFAEDGKTLVLPAVNISSLLGAINTMSAPKRFTGKAYKSIAQAILGYTTIEPWQIPLTRKGKPIVFDGFGKNGIRLDKRVARLKNGVPNPKLRPVVELPWELSFTLTLYENEEVSEAMLKNLLQRGGLSIGLGTFRGVFGKFIVEQWE